MFGWLTRRPVVAEDIAVWVDEVFAWYAQHFSVPTEVILPQARFFSAGKGRDQSTAQAVLADIQRHMGLEAPIDLVPLGRMSAQYRHSYQTLGEVAGSCEWVGDRWLIRYDPDQMEQPIHFISTMAHEAMHVRLLELNAPRPGGDAAEEPLTDLCCIVAGFGLFQLRTSEELGWAGYLSQPTRAYALARYLHQRGQGFAALQGGLPPRGAAMVRRALRSLS